MREAKTDRISETSSRDHKFTDKDAILIIVLLAGDKRGFRSWLLLEHINFMELLFLLGAPPVAAPETRISFRRYTFGVDTCGEACIRFFQTYDSNLAIFWAIFDFFQV